MLTPHKDKRSKEKMSKDLEKALCLLFKVKKLDSNTGLTRLEQEVLALTAFLRPWSDYRDSFFLAPSTINDAPRGCNPGDITRQHILWFYTNYAEGNLRFDPKNPNVDRAINKSGWGAVEYEKLLYAWLLQEFKVGKLKNPFGIKYFQCKNQATAYEEVFVPIVNAVRESYSKQGRRSYGRLAMFIEERSPSELAFPLPNIGDSNVAMDVGPYTSTSKAHASNQNNIAVIGEHSAQGMVASKEEKENQELRETYPEFGGLFERPKFKKSMTSWLSEQREKKAREKVLKKLEANQNPMRHGVTGEDPTQDSLSLDRLSRNSLSSIRRSLSLRSSIHTPSPQTILVPYGMYGYTKKPLSPTRSIKSEKIVPEDELRSPRHGVTRDVELPRTLTLVPRSPAQTPKRKSPHHENFDSISDSEVEPFPDLPVAKLQYLRKNSDGEHTIRRSNTFSQTFERALHQAEIERISDRENHDIASLSRRSSYSTTSRAKQQLSNTNEVCENPYETTKRLPSYEGTGYFDEITASSVNPGSVIRSQVHPALRGRRTPASIQSAPYHGNLHAVSSYNTIETTSSEAKHPVPFAVQEHSPPLQNRNLGNPAEDKPIPIPWPGQEDSPPRQKHTAITIPWMEQQEASRLRNLKTSNTKEDKPDPIPWPGKEESPPLPGSKGKNRIDENPAPNPWPGQEDSPRRGIRKFSNSREDKPTLRPWSGQDSPPLPAKSPLRYTSTRRTDHGTSRIPRLNYEKLANETLRGTLGSRIVSKENIRAALGRTSPESEGEVCGTRAKKQDVSKSSAGSLNAYNSHMFPRQGEEN